MDRRGVKVRRGQKEKIAVVVLMTACLSVCWFDFGFGYKVRSIIISVVGLFPLATP